MPILSSSSSKEGAGDKKLTMIEAVQYGNVTINCKCGVCGNYYLINISLPISSGTPGESQSICSTCGYKLSAIIKIHESIHTLL